MNRGLTVLGLLLVGALAFGQVDKDELNKGQDSGVVFTNYVGPHNRIDSVDQIVGIGLGLGKTVGSAPATYAGKYSLIHAVGPADGAKLDADIFVIEAGGEVDEVVNIMRMVSGYLQAAYGYSPADAMVLARFVVYYNAVFRGNLTYLGGVYKTVVMNNVTAENAGIATKYTDWPGKTRMLIPLSIGAAKGNLSAVGASQLASPPVIQNLQEQPGKALPERKDLTELQQKAVEQGQAQVQQQQQQLQQDQQQLTTQTAALDQAKQAADQANQTAAATGATDQQKQAAAQASAAVTQQEQAVAQQGQKVQQDQQAVAQGQAQVAAGQQAVQQQRATIAADTQALIQQQPAQANAQTTTAGTTAAPGQLLFIYAVVASPEKLGKLVLIDRVSGKLLSQSDLNTVRGRTYATLGTSLVVIAGSTGGTAAVRLVSVDPATLAIQQQGKDNLAPTSFLASSDTSVYAVLSTAKGNFLGRFDGTLAVQAQSEKAVDASTYIVVSGTEVFVQDSTGNILILNKDDLKEKKRNG
jgi:pyruvate/2-oxoglutarate dehydrogenase complex dihydrolipoamide acyltransferase (E2) component